MKSALLCYRGLYGLTLAVLLASVIRQIRLDATTKVDTLLTFLLAFTLLVAISATIALPRFRISVLWICVLLLGILFTWYGWYSSNSPFVLHELHTFDPILAVNEKSRHNMHAIEIYASFLLWFISLPVVGQIFRRH